MRSFTKAATAMVALSGTTDAFFRMECFSRTALARMDPLVNPGDVSQHAHVIHGGVNFGLNTTYDDLRASKCTSCRVVDDKSAYWTPALYFEHANGTFEIVPQVGGMLVYYNPISNGDQKVEAYPAGFRMIAGNNKLRSFYTNIASVPEKSLYREEDLTQPALAQKGIGFNCLNYKANPEPAFYRHEFPEKPFLDKQCLDGIRAEIAFPSCWDGRPDSDNHQDHVAYPSAIESGGTCPEGFDRRLPTMLFETKWNTYAFKDMPGRFMFANGDPTGFGYHGDYIMGWDQAILQDALDKCTNPSGRIDDCPVFSSQTQLQTESKCTECKMQLPEVLAKEDCAGPMDALCGGDAVSSVEGASAPNKPADPKPADPAPAAPTSEAVSVPSTPAEPSKAPESKPSVGIPAPVNQDAVAVAVPAPSPEPVAASVPAPAPPAPTAPPAQPLPEGPVTAATTLYRTLSDRVEEVVYVEQTETVFVTAAAARRYRRHADAHHRRMHKRDGEHGLLGHMH